MGKQNNKSEFIDIKGIFSRYIRKWYWFLISLIIAGGCAYVYVKVNPRKSLVRSSILVGQDDATASMLNGLGGLFGADPYVQDEIFVITSHSVLAEVARTLQVNKTHVVKTGFLTKNFVYPEYPVDVFAAPSLIDTLQTTIRFKVDVKGNGKADILAKNTSSGITLKELKNVQLPATVKTSYGEYIVNTTDTYTKGTKLTSWVYITGYDSAAEDLAEEIAASIASKKSNVIELALPTTNPVYGETVLNEVMKVYNARGIDERNQRAQKTADFLADRINLIANDLNAAESQIEQYKESNKLVDVAAEAAYNTQMKSEMERRLITAETENEILRMTAEFISKPANKYELLPTQFASMGGGEGTASSTSNVMGTYNDLVLRRINLLNTARPDNRAIVEIEQQIDAMRSNIIVALDRAIKNSNVTIRDLRTQANTAIARLGNVPTQERQLLNLKRQQQVKQELYLFLLQRSEETAMLIANAIPKGIIIDEAYVMRDPVGLGKFAVLAIAIFIGLFIPILALYIGSNLRSKIENLQDLQRNTNLPILGEMCIDRSGDNIVVGTDNTSASSELFRMLRTNLQFVLSNPGDRVVMITSSVSGEGKSFISSNLAASLALLGKHVVLVGIDIRRPQLANYLGIPSTPGLTQYLSNYEMTPDDIIRPYDSVSGMDVIVAGPIPPNPGELMTSPRVEELITYLRKNYDYVLLDTAPVGMVSDTFQLTRMVDATVCVVRTKKTKLQDIRFINSLVEEERLKRASLVLNGSTSKKGYGYGYNKK